VDDETRPKYIKRRMPPFQPMPDMAPMNGYYQVPPGVVEDADEMATWAREAVAVGETKSQKPKATRKKPKGRRKKEKGKSQKPGARS
jgi:TfoX/Sxy family transcriptional regulator of competence genes